MSVYGSRAISTKGSTLYMEGNPIEGVNGVTGLDGGTATTIDVTPLAVTYKQMISGFPTAGEVNVTGTLAPQSDIVKALRLARDNGSQHAFGVLLPMNIDPNTKAALLTGRVVTQPQGTRASTMVDTTHIVNYTLSNTPISSLPAIGNGDYIKLSTGTTTERIASVSNVANTITITTEVDAGSAQTASTGTVQVIRPPARYSFVASVSTFSTELAVDDAVRFNLTLVVLDAIELEVGTPDLTAITAQPLITE